MNTTILFIAASIVASLIILLILFGTIAFQRIRTTKRRRKFEHAIESRHSDWYAYLIEGSLEAEALAPSGRIEIEAADEVIFRYWKNFQSEHIHYRMMRYMELYLEPYYRELLSSNQWSIRVNALQRIFHFRIQFMADAIYELVDNAHSYSKEETMLIYKNLAMLFPTKFISHFTNPKIPLGEFDYRRLLMPLEQEQLDLLLRQFNELPVVMQHVLVDIIGAKFLWGYSSLLEECLTSEDAELRIRALKALSILDTFPESDCASPFVQSEIWEERLMVAKLFANAPLEEAHENLSILLKDAVYQVRRQAAASLHAIRTGDAVLNEFIRQSDDLYAIEIAKEMTGKEATS